MNIGSTETHQSSDGGQQVCVPSRGQVAEPIEASRAGGHAHHESLRVAFPVSLVPQSAAASRRVAREAFTTWNLDLGDPAVDGAIVVLSEPVTNAVKHARVLCRVADVALALDGGVLTICVHDRHPYRPIALAVPHSAGCGGRGLALVRDLVDELGGSISVPADSDRRGKKMRVAIPVDCRASFIAGEPTARRVA